MYIRCALFAVFLYLLVLFLINPSDFSTQLTYKRPPFFAPTENCHQSCDKWIVVTSISSPTDDVKRLASLPEWNLVVVADEKTPTNWSLPGVHLLSVFYQKNLGFSFVQQLPFFSYTRKAVGYLYAIQHGAKFIYDTDDDNKPFGQGLGLFDYSQSVSGLRFVPSSSEDEDARHRTFNPYRFFGQPSIWPRGFPLEWISSHDNGNKSMEVCRNMKTSAVQQGLVHKDPDVDAIYRLMKADSQDGLNEHFNAFAPPISLSKGTFAPWNSQNTLFSYPAFFTMFLPTTVSFRTTDIWRSFFAQKLLHLVDETVAFYPPNAVQFRNSHSFLKDFVSEKEVYYESGAIIEFLHQWKCQEKTIIECTLKLADEFRERKFIEEDDVTLIGLWIDTLQRIGYEFPPLYTSPQPREKEECWESYIEFTTDQSTNETLEIDKGMPSKLEQFQQVLTWCGEVEDENSTFSIDSPPVDHITANQLKLQPLKDKMNSVAIITNNWPWKHSIGRLQRLYQPYFAITVFCGTFNDTDYDEDKSLPIIQPLNRINIPVNEMWEGNFHYICLSRVKSLRLQNVKGYYLFSDDVTLNIWNGADANLIHSPLRLEKVETSVWPSEYGIIATNNSVRLLRGKYKKNEKVQEVWKKYQDGLKKHGLEYSNFSGETFLTTHTFRTPADYYYIPTHQMDYVCSLFDLFYESQYYLGLAFNKLLYTVDFIHSPGIYLLTNEQKDIRYSLYNKSISMMHPIKLSFSRTNETEQRGFCNTIVKAFQEALFS